MQKELFKELPDDVQEQYAREAETLYDPEAVRSSNAKWNARSKDERKAIIDEDNRIYADLSELVGKDPSSPEVAAVIERWRRHIWYFWTPSIPQLMGLADLYNTDPCFKANFECIHPRLAEFLRDAVAAYVGNIG